MVSVEKVRLEAERGAKADALMRDPLWSETFDALAAGYAEAWAATAPSDAARREERSTACSTRCAR